MSELKKIRKWYWIWEFEEEERWLNQMADAGWVLEKLGFAVFYFRPCEPGEYIVRTEMRGKDDAYVGFVEETGAEYVGRMAKWIYFRRKTELGDFQLFSDLESRIGHLQKAAKVMKGVGIANLLIGMANTFNPGLAGVPIGWINLLCAALCMYAYGRLQGKLDAMEKDRSLME